jgi:transketolase
MREIDNIRILCADMVQKANSGHPGAPLSLAPLAYLLFTEYLKFDPDDPEWANRDIFILSNGHACALQYAMGYLKGHMTMDDLKGFRQVGSRTPGHPEKKGPGIECTTGPLGQGVSNAVGYAISLKKLGMKELTNKVYCIFGDGCYEEGIGQEAFSIAACLRLDNIIFFYDSNRITIDGPTSLSMNEDAEMRFRSLGYQVDVVEGGEDLDAIRRALDVESRGPRVIILKTVIGYGSIVEGKAKAHGSPLGEEGVKKLRERFNMPQEPFCLLPSLLEKFEEVKKRMRALRKEWDGNNGNLERFVRGRDKFLKGESLFKSEYKRCEGPKATRKHFNEALNDLKETRFLIGGAADLATSVLTKIEDIEDFTAQNPTGGAINYGTREHAMCGIMNGIASHGYFVPFGGTFLNFITYGFPSVRLGCMERLNLFYILSHDSIGLGEDGPTHQPIETLLTLRATPNIVTMRPCDGVESRAALKLCIRRRGPKAVVTSRQKLAPIPDTSEEKAMRGAYFLIDTPEPDVILLSTGSEVQLCYELVKALPDIRISVVSFFSWELFEEQDAEYRASILKDVPRISIEALGVYGWHKYSDMQIGMTTFGMSGPCSEVYKYFDLVPDKIGPRIRQFLNK